MKTSRQIIHESGYVSGRVQRWHTWPTIHKPNVAEHQCRVAQIYCELWGLPRAEVLYHCINHDRGEQYAGDVPFGAKSRVDGLQDRLNTAEHLGLEIQGVSLPELTSDEYKKFKVCDVLEMHEFCVCELAMGNVYAKVPMHDLETVALQFAYELCEHDKVNKFMRRRQL